MLVILCVHIFVSLPTASQSISVLLMRVLLAVVVMTFSVAFPVQNDTCDSLVIVYSTLCAVQSENISVNTCYTGAGRVQARPHGVQLSAQPSTPVPRRPLPVCIQYRLRTTPSLCQPRSSRRASLSSQQLRSAGFLRGRPCDMELVTRQYERPGHQQTPSDIFIFSLLVYIAH